MYRRLVLGFAFALISCNGLPIATPTQSVPISPIPSASERSLTPTIRVVDTRTPPMTVTIGKPVSTLSLTPSLEPFGTTPVPTLPANEAQALILTLFQDNGGCQLPCWWGMTPGQTGIQTILSTFGKFSNLSLTELGDHSSGSFRWRFSQDNLLIDLGANYDTFNTDTVEKLSVGVQLLLYWPENSEYIILNDPKLYSHFVPSYALPAILSTYGQPSKVMFFADKALKEFHLSLLYPEQGIYAQYTAHEKTHAGKFVMCPLETYPGLTLWPPDHQTTHEEILAQIENAEIGWYKPLDEATSLTLADFYRIFKDTQSAECIESPINIWPEP